MKVKIHFQENIMISEQNSLKVTKKLEHTKETNKFHFIKIENQNTTKRLTTSEKLLFSSHIKDNIQTI